MMRSLKLLILLWPLLGLIAPVAPGIPSALLGASAAEAAFPQVASVTEDNSAVNAEAFVQMPATVDPGDLLIMAIEMKGFNKNATVPTGWTELGEDEQHGNGSGYVFAIDAIGNEDSTTVEVPFSGTSEWAAQTIRITGWEGTLGTAVDISTKAEDTANDSPNPGSVTAGWGSDDNLYIALALTNDDDATCTAYPTDYINGTDTVSGGGSGEGATICSAEQDLTDASDDPAVFTLSEAEGWLSYTIVIQPEAAAAIPLRRKFEERTKR